MEIVVLIGCFLLVMCGFGYLDERLRGGTTWEILKNGLVLIPLAGLGLGAFFGHKLGFKETSWQIVVVAIVFQIAYFMGIAFLISSLTSA